MSADYTVRLDRVFHGPMDLPLHLLREQAVNAESTAQRRSREKSTSRNYQKFQRDGRRFKQGED